MFDKKCDFRLREAKPVLISPLQTDEGIFRR
jgi:hypothetical protein